MTLATKVRLSSYDKDQLKQIREFVPEGNTRAIYSDFRPGIFVSADPSAGEDGEAEVALTFSSMRYRPHDERERNGGGYLGRLEYSPWYTHAYLSPKQARKLIASLTVALENVKNGDEYGYDD